MRPAKSAVSTGLRLREQPSALVGQRLSINKLTEARSSSAPCASEKPVGGAKQQVSGIGISPKTAFKRPLGYTPFEYITFSDELLTHEIITEVKAPAATIFEAWKRQENYGDWFTSLGQTILQKDDKNIVSLFIYYQWGQLPALELYTTLVIEEEKDCVFIRMAALDGMHMAAFVLLSESEDKNAVEVLLRLGYQLPANLTYYVGPAGIWGDVNDILIDGMQRMKAMLEVSIAS